MTSSHSVLRFFVAFFALICTFHLSLAAPVPIRNDEAVVSRDVFVPLILEPSAAAVWTVGTTQVVTWDVSSPPKQITNKHGRIVLRSEETGLLDYSNPLAAGFDILKGSHEVVVPNVKPGIYQIVLFGNSGNWGESFTIVGNAVSASEETAKS